MKTDTRNSEWNEKRERESLRIVRVKVSSVANIHIKWLCVCVCVPVSIYEPKNAQQSLLNRLLEHCCWIQSTLQMTLLLPAYIFWFTISGIVYCFVDSAFEPFSPAIMIQRDSTCLLSKLYFRSIDGEAGRGSANKNTDSNKGVMNSTIRIKTINTPK